MSNDKIYFHLPFSAETFGFAMCISEVLKMKPEYFRDNVEIGSFFGGFPVKWSGGRLVRGKFYPAKAQAYIDALNQQGIPFRLTFTNPLITEEDLGDRECNWLLGIADNGMNGVLVVSEPLEAHIRQTHPGLKISSSTCKCIRSMDAVKEELAKGYALVVLDYNFNNDYAELEKLTPEERSRCELLANAACKPACPRRAEHYRFIGGMMKDHLDEVRDCYNEDGSLKIKDWECSDSADSPFFDSSVRINPDDIYDKLVPMGFRHFKLEGRLCNCATQCEFAVQYMAKPEHIDEARYHIHYALYNNIGLNYI